MKHAKTQTEERTIILNQPLKRPYGVKIRIHVQTAGSIGNLDKVGISLASGAYGVLGSNL